MVAAATGHPTTFSRLLFRTTWAQFIRRQTARAGDTAQSQQQVFKCDRLGGVVDTIQHK